MSAKIFIVVHPEPGMVVFISTKDRAQTERLEDAWDSEALQEIRELDFVDEANLDIDGDLSVDLIADKLDAGKNWYRSLSALVAKALDRHEMYLVEFVLCRCSQPAGTIRARVGAMSSSTKQFTRR